MKKSGKIVQISFLIALVIIIVSGAITYKTTKEFTDTSNSLLETYRTNVELEQIISYLKDAETGLRGYVITSDSLFLEPYLSSREKINNSFAELKELTKDDEHLQNELKKLNSLISKRLTNFEESLSFVNKKDTWSSEFKANFLEGKKIMDSIRAMISSMVTYENTLLKERENNFSSSLSLTPVFLLSLILISIILILLAYIQITRDVKTLKQNNEKLELFKKTTEQAELLSKQGSWTWNLEKEEYTYSDNLYRLLGEEPNSFEPGLNNFLKFVHPEDLDKLNEDIKQMRKAEDLPFLNYRVIHKDGTIRHLKAYGQEFVIDGQKHLVGTTTDITEEIEYYKVLKEKNEVLEKSNKELSAFNHIASHDLQEPLRKIQTFLSRLVDKEKDNISENSKIYITKILDAATRMRNLINDLLQFSRTNTAEKNFEKTDLNQVFEDAKQDLIEVIEESKAIITSEKLPNLKVISFQMQQLFINLIGNSIKYQKPNSVPEITVTYKKVKKPKSKRFENSNFSKYHKLTFSDNGIGFDNQYADKIFNLFSRLHNKNEYSGTGIGLSICKKIVENHNGYIFAKGEKGKGASFKIYLPA